MSKLTALIFVMTIGFLGSQTAGAREECACLVKQMHMLTNHQWDLSMKCLRRDMQTNKNPARSCAKACLTLEEEDAGENHLHRSVLKTYTGKDTATAPKQCSDGLAKLYDNIYGTQVDVAPKL